MILTNESNAHAILAAIAHTFDSPSGQSRAEGEGKGETRNKEKEKEGWGQKRWIHGLRCGSGGKTGALRELEARDNLNGSFYEKTRGARKRRTE